MSAFRTVLRNVASNWAGFLVNAAIALQLTPYVERHLGESQWGFWSLLIAFTGYYGLLDLGIRSAVAQYVTRYWARKDLAGVLRTKNTAFGILLAIAAGIVPVTIGMAWVAPWIFTIDGVDDSSVRLLFAIVGCFVALNLPLTIFQTATYARQRFDIANGVGIVQRLGAAALTVWALDAGHGLVTLCFIHLGANLVGNLVYFLLSFRLLPGLELSRRHWSRDSVKELFGFSVWNVLINAADQVQVHGSALVITIILDSTALAHFNMGAILLPYALQLVNSIAWTLTPQAMTLDAKGEGQGLQRLYLDGTRAIFAFASILCAGMVLLGDDFLRLWARPIYTDGANYISSSTILAMLCGGLLLRSAATCGKQVCFGLREVRFLARVTFAEAVINLGLTAFLVWHFGILGGAIANVCAVALTQLWMLPQYLVRRIGVSWLSIPRTLFAGILVLLAMPALRMLVFPAGVSKSWLELVLRGAVLGIFGLSIGLLCGTTRAEKAKILGRFRRAPAG